MPLLDHFQGPRRWEGPRHAWAAPIAQHLNQEVLLVDVLPNPRLAWVRVGNWHCQCRFIRYGARVVVPWVRSDSGKDIYDRCEL